MQIILEGKTEVFTVAHSEMQCFCKHWRKMSIKKYLDFFSIVSAHILSKYQEGRALPDKTTVLKFTLGGYLCYAFIMERFSVLKLIFSSY